MRSITLRGKETIMNPQFQSTPGFAQNRPPPSITPSNTFQNVSLVPPKQSGMTNGANQHLPPMQRQNHIPNAPLQGGPFPPPPQNSFTTQNPSGMQEIPFGGQPSSLKPLPNQPPTNQMPPSLHQIPPSLNQIPPQSQQQGRLLPDTGFPPSGNQPPLTIPPNQLPPQNNLMKPWSPSTVSQSQSAAPPPMLPQVSQQTPLSSQLPPLQTSVSNQPSEPLGSLNQFSVQGNSLNAQNQTPPNPLKISGPSSLNGPAHGYENSQVQGNFPPNPNSRPLNSGFMSQNGPPSNLNQGINNFNPSMAGPPPLSGAPPPSQFSQPPLPGQNMPSQNHFTQPPLSNNQNQFEQPPLSGQPPLLGRPPMPNKMPNQPLPNQNQFGQPPLPGQHMNNQFGPNQLTNQMQGMHLGGPRQYPTGTLKGTDNGPHMPPPLSQQDSGMMPGQQMRSPSGPGYPPMPGQGQLPSGPGVYPQSGYQQAQQRRLDPDQMPSPIQVMQDDQHTRSGVFVTNQKGLVPPLVSTKFVVQDQGNTSPRFVRSTMYNVPISQDQLKQTAVPFGLVISPMARTVEGEYPPPIVNFGDLGPVRCIRCKAYMCPYMQFIDSGRRFQCLFCKAATDVPNEYFQHLDHTGQRMDRYERPELVLGTYEFTATSDYCRNNTLPKPPAIIFVIDVSYNNVKSGLVHLLCSNMKDIIKNLPKDQGQEESNMRVGFITYSNCVHFYNIKGTLAAPQMLVVGDTQEMFMPLLDGFLCTPEESSAVIDLLMEQIPIMFGDTRETETILLPAILAGLEALKASESVGKLLVFHSTLPVGEAPGKLKNRDDRKLLGTEKERTVLVPQTQAYNQLGQDCVQFGCSVDLFLFNNAYIDIATIGQVSRLTGGEVFKYTYFQADIDGERLVKDVIADISRPVAFDGVMRVRTSTGVRPTDFYGHCYMSNTTDIELASIDCDKALAVEIKHDDKLSEEEGIYIQVALLYTSCSGQRRLRIMNLSLKTCSQMADLYRSCDLDTLINFFGKQSVYKLLEHNPKAIKDGLVNRAAQILANYRKNCASPSSAGQLILPECMKLLPLYVNCLLKSDALSGGSDITLDDRSFVMQVVMHMDVPTSVAYFYPRLIPIHDLKANQDPVEVPAPIRCTIEKITDQGVYILENGIHMFMWIGLGANADFIQQVFGVPSAVQVNIEMIKLPELDNPLSEAVRSIVEQIRIQRHRCMRLTLVRQREKMESVFKHFLVEDRGIDGSPSYVDFLCHMHKEIRNLLS